MRVVVQAGARFGLLPGTCYNEGIDEDIDQLSKNGAMCHEMPPV
jgi:hypothetical protein